MNQKTVNDCVAAVAAMATGNNIQDFKRFYPKSNGKYSEWQFYKYLTECGYACGMAIENPDFKTTMMFNFAFRLKDHPCAMVVRLLNGKTHMVYWDGIMIHDPRPKVSDGLPLSDYNIEKIIPISRVK